MNREADRARWVRNEARRAAADLSDSIAAADRAEARKAHCFEQLAFWLSPWQVAGHPGESNR